MSGGGRAPTLAGLRESSFETLVDRLRAGPAAAWPHGVWRSHWLMPWPDRSRASDVANEALFGRTPNGLDLDHATWWFVRPWLRTAAFSVSFGASRFLPGTTLARLEYGRSRLPIRGLLYDEIQPLADDLLLGLGALDFGPGRGERFLFALTPIDRFPIPYRGSR